MARPSRILPPDAVDPAAVASSGSLTDVAYARIKAAILEGALPPGLLAAEQQIAGRLAMSRTPVHQAIVRLEQEGWIQLLPRRGVLIAPVSAAEMHDIYEALLALEVAAVGRLARGGSIETVEALEHACDDAERALERDDLPAWAAADDRFHAMLVEMSGNRHIARLSRTVMEQVQRARLLTLRLRPRPSASNADHRAILEALRAGDEATACARMREHRERGMQILLPILEALAVRTHSFFQKY